MAWQTDYADDQLTRHALLRAHQRNIRMMDVGLVLA